MTTTKTKTTSAKTRPPRAHTRVETPPDPRDTRDVSPDARDPHDAPVNARDAMAPTPASPAPLTAKQEREALRAAGMKRCPSHLRLLDRLPDEARHPVGEYDDVSIRPLTEYQKSTSTCRACDHVIARDWRAAHKHPESHARQEQTLTRLIAQRDALTVRIVALQATLATAPTD